MSQWDVAQAVKRYGGALSGCLQKKRYKSEKGARMAIEMNPKAGIRYYKCKHCLEWHTTSKEYDPK